MFPAAREGEHVDVERAPHEMIVHMFYGGMPRAKAEKSLRLFVERVLPAVQAMPTPINPASLGQSTR